MDQNGHFSPQSINPSPQQDESPSLVPTHVAGNDLLNQITKLRSLVEEEAGVLDKKINELRVNLDQLDRQRVDVLNARMRLEDHAHYVSEKESNLKHIASIRGLLGNLVNHQQALELLSFGSQTSSLLLSNDDDLGNAFCAAPVKLVEALVLLYELTPEQKLSLEKWIHEIVNIVRPTIQLPKEYRSVLLPAIENIFKKIINEIGEEKIEQTKAKLANVFASPESLLPNYSDITQDIVSIKALVEI